MPLLEERILADGQMYRVNFETYLSTLCAIVPQHAQALRDAVAQSNRNPFEVAFAAVEKELDEMSRRYDEGHGDAEFAFRKVNAYISGKLELVE